MQCLQYVFHSVISLKIKHRVCIKVHQTIPNKSFFFLFINIFIFSPPELKKGGGGGGEAVVDPGISEPGDEVPALLKSGPFRHTCILAMYL